VKFLQRDSNKAQLGRNPAPSCSLLNALLGRSRFWLRTATQPEILHWRRAVPRDSGFVGQHAGCKRQTCRPKPGEKQRQYVARLRSREGSARQKARCAYVSSRAPQHRRFLDDAYADVPYVRKDACRIPRYTRYQVPRFTIGPSCASSVGLHERVRPSRRASPQGYGALVAGRD
jgi:hypothetical protein